MNRKLILIGIAVGVVSFVGMFTAGWFSRPSAAVGETTPVEPGAAAPPGTMGIPGPQVPGAAQVSSQDDASLRAMTEQQLRELIYDVREKIAQYDTKLKALETEEERLQIARQMLRKDVETLSTLQVDVATAAAVVRSERDALMQARVEVEQAEKANLIAIAAAYDKMAPSSAGDILVSMSQGQSANDRVGRAGNIDDAVKILYFMQERTKAKVLEELVTKEPALASTLCQKLKQVREGK